MKIGFIGCGNMGQAMVSGMLASGKIKTEDLIISDKTLEARVKLKDKYGVYIAESNTEVAMISDVIFLAVKPQFYEEVITEIKSPLSFPSNLAGHNLLSARNTFSLISARSLNAIK